MSSSSSAHPTTDATDGKPGPALDWRQVVGGAGAASVVTYATSRVGLAGTIAGAAIMSIVAAVTSTYLARAAHQTERQVRKVARLKSAAASAHAPTAAEAGGTQPDLALPHPEPAPEPEDRGQGWPWRRVAIFAGIVFAATIAVVYFVGVATGADQPIAPAAPPRTPAPAVTTADPQSSVTPTISGAAPTQTGTATATATSTATPTPSPTVSATGASAPAATSSPTSGG